MNTNEQKIKENTKEIEFVKQISRYFMDFLETDFKKRRYPKRSVKHVNKDNLLIGISLAKYPSFVNVVWKNLNKNFENNISIPANTYKTKIPQNVFKLIELQIEKISTVQIEKVLETIRQIILKSIRDCNSDFELTVGKVTPLINNVLKQEIVVPFAKNIETSLLQLSADDLNVIFLVEEELTEILFSMLYGKLIDIIQKEILKDEIDIVKEFFAVFRIKDIKEAIHTFFKSFQVGDLRSEVLELKRNNRILDKQELYLYFCDITYAKETFPIFYIPIEVDSDNTIEFASQVYINKRAIDFIVQEYNKVNDKSGTIDAIKERIIYLAHHTNDFPQQINKILEEITTFFGLDKKIDITSFEKQISKGLFCNISNSCYIALFDRSDEALVNDYEEILDLLAKEDSALVASFGTLINDFIYKEPESFTAEIGEKWDSLTVGDKLVYNTPIPLNSEQRSILSAIRKDGCKYIVVEGPPGTGKSHTITAIVCDAILRHQSVLVLSDKKEALDVVEDKITDAINKIRDNKDFQNPILRLGKTGSTYNQILNTGSINQIRLFHKVINKKFLEIENEVEKLNTTLKEDIQTEIISYEEIKLSDLYELMQLEKRFSLANISIDTKEFFKTIQAIKDLCDIRECLLSIKSGLAIEEVPILKILDFSISDFKTIKEFQDYINCLKLLIKTYDKLKNVYTYNLNKFNIFTEFSSPDLWHLNNILEKYEKEKTPVFGFLFKKKKIFTIDTEFKQIFDLSAEIEPHKNLIDLGIVKAISKFAQEYYASICTNQQKYDVIKVLHKIITEESTLSELQNFFSVEQHIINLSKFLTKYPSIQENNDILASFSNFENNFFTDYSDEDFETLISYLTLKHNVTSAFDAIPQTNYSARKDYLEKDITYKMAYIIDERLINFYDNNKATATTLKNIIRSKQKFPKNVFSKLKEAFPCILAGIRDYAEYIPLQPEIFDLIIIDEASQVSIAQAFPALLRSKKVLILGDRKQFSNVKTAQARTEVNREYTNNLKDCFVKNISTDNEKLVKVDKFNIKTSILDFFDYISNYSTQLLKHFRGYKELISYSNRYFYKNDLQVMKIRGKAIDDVLKFSFIEHDGREEDVANTNTMEAEFIVSQLNLLKESGDASTVGIITPHTNQQKLLIQLIDKTINKDYFYDTLKLKIMTFDTCQGEERDVIYYSMVATEKMDRLWGVFIKDLASVDIEEDGKIKAQRLNVGFSRAKEQMHFVLSKPLESYEGAIGDALRHYYGVLLDVKKESSATETDENSEMEKHVLNWFYQTSFWQENKDKIEFKPQFELGKYLAQLDKTYTHPNYRVDFLLIYKSSPKEECKIIIEYDGFEEHFKDPEAVTNLNYMEYYTDSDVFRQKVLESYGYKFLRINKFNLGENPVKVLDDRLKNLLKKTDIAYELKDSIRQTFKGISSGDMKECPKCKEIRAIGDFKDDKLITGHGRICRHCKNDFTYVPEEHDHYKPPKVFFNTGGHEGCPICGSSMRLRRGKYNNFYGCSRFPLCRGTRSARGS
ncbi:very-short-patch-repair endonuclease [Elusimicrobium simillimum]|uniref:AAA domain-containing protein n=1 Tax=Elusimicrobium simillimum TaxID=3143438 RepID=UPI003C7002DC